MNQLIRSNGRLGSGLCITGIIAVLHVSLDGCVTPDSKSNSHDNLGTRIERYTLRYVYYFSNTLLFERDYEFVNSINCSGRSGLEFHHRHSWWCEC